MEILALRPLLPFLLQEGKEAETSWRWARLAKEEQRWSSGTQLVTSYGLWPSRVTTDTTSLAIQKSLPRTQGGQRGQMPSLHCPSSFLLQWGDRCQVRNTKVITFSSFQSSPKPQAHNRDTQSPRAHKVSSLETGYSIRVTPTCKTETIALTKLSLPPKVGTVPHIRPLLGVREGHRVMGAGRMGSSFPE